MHTLTDGEREMEQEKRNDANWVDDMLVEDDWDAIEAELRQERADIRLMATTPVSASSEAGTAEFPF